MPTAKTLTPTDEALGDLRAYQAKRNANPIAVAHQAMVTRLAAITPPRIYANPDPEEFEATAEYLLAVARIVDTMILAVGCEVASSATTRIDLRTFTDVLKDALEGFAVFHIHEEATAIKEDRAS